VDRLDLAGLIASRLCHDLAGPVSALANGAELLETETDEVVRAEFVAIMGKGAAQLTAKLRFYRLVFGGGAALPVAAAEARAVLSDYIASDRQVSLDWRLDEEPVARSMARLLLALAALAAETTDRGGTVCVALSDAGACVEATGMRVVLPRDQRDILTALEFEILPAASRAAFAHLAATLAARLGADVIVREEPGMLSLSVRLR